MKKIIAWVILWCMFLIPITGLILDQSDFSIFMAFTIGNIVMTGFTVLVMTIDWCVSAIVE